MNRSSRTHTKTVRRALALPLLALLATSAAAETGLVFAVDTVEGDGWRADDISVSLTLNPDGRVSAALVVAALQVPDLAGPINGIGARCATLSVDAGSIRCSGIGLTPGSLPVALPDFDGALLYERDSGRLRWDLAAKPETGGSLRLRGSQLGDGWSIAIESEGLAIADLVSLADLAALLDESRSGVAADGNEASLPANDDPAPAAELFGSLDLSAEASGSSDRFSVSFQGRADGAGGSNASGTRAADAVAFEFDGNAGAADAGLNFDARVIANTGEVYLEPVYVRLDDHPLTLSIQGNWSEEGLSIGDLRIAQQGVLSGSGTLLMVPPDTVIVDQGAPEASEASDDVEPTAWTIASARLSFPVITLPGAYDVLMKPFLAGTDLGDMETSGQLSADIDVLDNAPVSIALNLDNVHMDDRSGRLGLYGLSSQFGWDKGRKDTAEEPVLISWQGGFVYGISLGPTRLEFAVEPGQWRLREPGLIPFLNGGVAIDTLEIGDFTPGNARVAIDARLQPVSMRALTRALDWPPLSGSLSGVIPSMSYVDGALTFGGELSAQMFDGEITVSNFRLREPFNPGSRLEADIEIEDLDLRLVTEALSFGLITGKLDGYVRGLRMYDWTPVAFDARLFTPPDDRSKHRISQRAVDNIANLGGGGGAAALSKGFLKFFEQFSYSGISFGCKMRDDTCEMSGLENQGNSYVILKGKGLPQINVVGYARRASWSTIVEQLKGIIESEGPVVE